MKYGVMIVTDVVVPKSYPTRRVSTSTGELLEHVGSNVFHSVLIKTANLTRKKKTPLPNSPLSYSKKKWAHLSQSKPVFFSQLCSLTRH